MEEWGVLSVGIFDVWSSSGGPKSRLYMHLSLRPRKEIVDELKKLLVEQVLWRFFPMER
jgi:hypothetical protein